MSKKNAVIGIGNSLRRDDGIGVVILESLFTLYKHEGIEYLNFGVATFDLIHKLSDYDSVLLIDGINATLPVGELKIFRLDEIRYDYESPAFSTHELDLKSIFELTKNFAIKTKIFVAGIQVKDVSFGERLSAPLKATLEKNLQEIRTFIDKTFG